MSERSRRNKRRSMNTEDKVRDYSLRLRSKGSISQNPLDNMLYDAGEFLSTFMGIDILFAATMGVVFGLVISVVLIVYLAAS